MSTPLPFTFTNESITVVYKGKPVVVQKGQPNFLGLRTAIIEEDWDAVPKHLTIVKSIKQWAKGKFTLSGDGETFSYEGKQIPRDINQRILDMATRDEDPTMLLNFFERLQKNPSFRSVKQLFPFLAHRGIPFLADGCFHAYKGVRSDYKDQHSGRFDNSPGKVHEMPRNQISDDPKEACHEGFHVGALNYAKSFSSRVVICKVAPEDVVCVPYDSSQEKMRVCKYEVVGNWNGEHLPSTTFVDDVREEPDYDEDDEDDFEEEINVEAPEESEAPEVSSRPAKKTPKKGYAKLDKMDMEGLMKQSIEDLRRYAGKGLEITGASKIPGGKSALVSMILKVRK